MDTAADPAQGASPASPAGTVAAEPGRPLILIVDDSPESIRLLSGLILDKGDVLFATSGEAGLNLARQRRPDLILLDVEMPDLSGYEVCRRLKDDPDTRDIAVMIVTSHHSSAHEVQALESGAIDFLTKPLAPAVVRARVQTQLTLKSQADALHRQAMLDGLTGLYNRAYFHEHLELEWRRHQRQQVPLGFALLDVDHFKAFNDQYGHVAGDACLRRVAEALKASTRRPAEFVVRYGGEEFAIVMPNTPREEIGRFGEWICRQVQDLAIPHEGSSAAPVVTISAGLAVLVPTPDRTWSDLIERADRALYRAKQEGRNRAMVAD
ncbi:MAG: diguanylate cyclase [Gammaproteobacteria bacterium]|nr:diguanylate cyclase [Gammaproteobacteria bacterium]